MKFVNLYSRKINKKAKLVGINPKHVWDLRDTLPVVIRDFLIKFKEENIHSYPLSYISQPDGWYDKINGLINKFDVLTGRLSGEDVFQKDANDAFDELKEVWLDLWD